MVNISFLPISNDPTKPDVWGATLNANLLAIKNAIEAVPTLDGSLVVKISESEYEALNPPNPETIYVVYADEAEPPPPPEQGTAATISDAFAATETPPATADTGQAWRVESGVWSQISGKLSADVDGAIIVAPLGTKTQTIEFTILGTMPAAAFPGPVMLYDNSNDWHYRILKANASQLAIYRRDPTQTTVWQSNVGVLAAGNKVRVSVSGSNGSTVFRVWVNDAEITTGSSGSLTDTDTTPPAGTECGFRYSFTAGGNTYQYGPVKMWNTVVAP